MRNPGKGPVELAILLANGGRVIHVDRCAHPVRDIGQAHAAEPQAAPVTAEARVGEEAGDAAAQYALAHTASATLGRPHHMQIVGGTGERNSSSGRTRIVALVCSLISASHEASPQNPA